MMAREWESLTAKTELARMHRDGHCLEAVMWYVHHFLESVKTATRWLGRVVVPPMLWKSYLHNRWVRLRQQRHRSCAEGPQPKYRPYEKGTTRNPGLASHCMSPRSRGVGTPRVCRPADYLPQGTVGQWPPATVQWWTVLKGRRPNNRPSDGRGLTHNSRAGNPKRKLPNCCKNENSQRGWHQCDKGRGSKNTTAQEVKDVVAPLTSTWLLRQLLDPEDPFDKMQAASPSLRRFDSFDRLKFHISSVTAGSTQVLHRSRARPFWTSRSMDTTWLRIMVT